jgi:hypothetical protein
MWVLNWICWKNSWCCFNIFEEDINKRCVWWLSWIFLCGVLACCIAGFVTANRFGFSLYGVQCAYERIYYDSVYGQIKKTYPKWEGFDYISTIFNSTINIILNIEQNSLPLEEFYFQEKEIDCNNKKKFLYPIYKDFAEKLCNLEDMSEINEDIYKGIYLYTEMAKHLDIIYKKKTIYKEQLETIKDIYNKKVNLEKYE